MRRIRPHRCCIACLAFVFAVAAARAESPPDPLRLLPQEADFVLKIENPRQLVDAVHYGEVIEQLQALPAFREQFDSTNVRRFLQLLTHYEKQLGHDRMELLDRLAGGGIALGLKGGGEPAPVLLIVQGKDEELMRKFLALTVEIAEAEAGRQEGSEPIKKDRYRNIEVVRFNKNSFATVAGSALLVSNAGKGLQNGLDLHLNGGKSLANSDRLAEARKQLPAKPLAWGWLNLETTLHKALGKDKVQNILIVLGGWFELARKSPSVVAGLYQQDNGYVTTVRMPKGRQVLSPEMAGHLPLTGEVATRPFLEPPGVLFSTSFYLDLAKFWEHRANILDSEQLQGLDDLGKKLGGVLAGADLGDLLGQFGTNHRLVVAHHPKQSYKTTPGQRLPAFAVVLEMRKPETLGRTLESGLRTAALLAGTQVRLKLVEETHGERTITGYRFVDGQPFPGDTMNLRFNFSPCFTRVGNQFVISSTLELCRDLIDALEKEAKGAAKTSPSVARVQLYAKGGVDVLREFADQLMAQTVLGQAVSPEEARQQVRALTELVRKLGTLRLETRYGDQDFRFDIVFTPQPGK